MQQAKACNLFFCEICIESIVVIALHPQWEGPDHPCHVDDAAAVCQIDSHKHDTTCREAIVQELRETSRNALLQACLHLSKFFPDALGSTATKNLNPTRSAYEYFPDVHLQGHV